MDRALPEKTAAIKENTINTEVRDCHATNLKSRADGYRNLSCIKKHCTFKGPFSATTTARPVKLRSLLNSSFLHQKTTNMKAAILLLAGAAFTVYACGNNASVKDMHDSTAGMQKSSSGNSAEAKVERNKNVVLQSFEGLNKHDPVLTLKDAAADIVDYGDGSEKPVKGKDSILSMMNGWMKTFPDLKNENLKTIAEGDWVVVWGDESGTWKGDVMNQKATGKSYKIKNVSIFRLNDEGKITEHHGVPTWNAIAEQVGMKTK